MAEPVKTNRRYIFLGLGLCAIILLGAIIIPKTAHPPYTSFSANPDGVKALFLLLNKEGVAAAQLRTAIPQDRGLMIMVEPDTNVSDEDWQPVLNWVEQGNTLFFAGAQSNGLYKHFGYELVRVSGGSGVHQVSSPDPLLKDVGKLTVSEQTRLKQHQSMKFAYGDEQGIYLAECVKGKGRVIFLTLPGVLTNERIGQDDNLILFLNIIRLYGQRNIWFNEFIHGYTWEKTTRELFNWPVRFVVIQLFLALFLLFYYWGRRFGRPVPLPVHRGLFSGDYVSSLAHIYRQGRARRLVLEHISQGFKHDLARCLGVPKYLPDGELLKICSAWPRLDTQRLKILLVRCAELMARPGFNETDLFTLTRDLEIWRQNNLNTQPKRRTKHD